MFLKYLLQVKLVREHSLAVTALGRLPGLPVGAGVRRRRAPLPKAHVRRAGPRAARQPGTPPGRPARRLRRRRNGQAPLVAGRVGAGCGRNRGSDGHQSRSVVVSRDHLRQGRRESRVPRIGHAVSEKSLHRKVRRAETPVREVEGGRVLRRLAGRSRVRGDGRRRRRRRRSRNERAKRRRGVLPLRPEDVRVRNVEEGRKAGGRDGRCGRRRRRRRRSEVCVERGQRFGRSEREVDGSVLWEEEVVMVVVRAQVADAVIAVVAVAAAAAARAVGRIVLVVLPVVPWKVQKFKLSLVGFCKRSQAVLLNGIGTVKTVQ